MNRRIRVIFTISILLNIVLIAAGVGMFYRFGQGFPMPERMSPEARSFVTSTFKSGHERMKPLIVEVKERRKAVESILMNDNFDRGTYDAAVERLLDTQGRIARTKAEIMGEALNDLSPEDRKEFSQQIIDGLTPGKPKWRPHGPKGREASKAGRVEAAEKPER